MENVTWHPLLEWYNLSLDGGTTDYFVKLSLLPKLFKSFYSIKQLNYRFQQVLAVMIVIQLLMMFSMDAIVC